MKVDTLSIHPTFECNQSCEICYMRKYKKADNFTLGEWLTLPKIASGFGVNQIACGGGEITLNPSFVRDFAKECKKNGVICNITTNGKPLKDYTDSALKMMFTDVTMVSISFNEFLIRSLDDIKEYKEIVKRVNKYAKTGVNLLLNASMIDNPKILLTTLEELFKMGAERIFLLHPKPSNLDITKIKDYIYAATIKWEHFYVDNSINQVIKHNSYKGWKHKCHFCKEFLSLTGRYLKGCSFQTGHIAKLNALEDLPKIVEGLKINGYDHCPAISGDKF